MKYTRLGNSGLEVSRLCLGCMGFGDETPGAHDWSIDEAASRPLIETALELGINFFDTANAYSLGSSEEIVGRALADMADRAEVVIATKVYFPMRGRARNSLGLSRKAIMTEVDNSLRRLGTDYIDLYQIHRYDDHTPIEETMRALHDVVEAGKVRYIGASSMWAWQFSKAQYVAEMNGWTKFISMQNQYSLLQREDERELYPLCADQGVGAIPWSPLARGLLARDWDETTTRSHADPLLAQRFDETRDRPIVDRVSEIAAAKGVPRAHIALAWVLGNPVVASPIVGATKLHHITEAVEALDLSLDEGERTQLEELYERRPASF
jgi:1-deoxyxylulose-5-phosphate synthase